MLQISHRNTGTVGWVFRFFDLLIAIPLALLFTPIILIFLIPTAFLIDPKVFYVQKRLGRHGQQIVFPKIRSMKISSNEDLNEEHESEYYRSMTHVIPAWGVFMRRYSLDELPQIFLVISGVMSLVGPRPIMQNEAAHFGKDLANIFSIKPGLTGYWQISGRKDLSWEDRVKLELRYLENRTLLENFKIIVRTIPAIFFGRGAY